MRLLSLFCISAVIYVAASHFVDLILGRDASDAHHVSSSGGQTDAAVDVAVVEMFLNPAMVRDVACRCSYA